LPRPRHPRSREVPFLVGTGLHPAGRHGRRSARTTARLAYGSRRDRDAERLRDRQFRHAGWPPPAWSPARAGNCRHRRQDQPGGPRRDGESGRMRYKDQPRDGWDLRPGGVSEEVGGGGRAIAGSAMASPDVHASGGDRGAGEAAGIAPDSRRVRPFRRRRRGAGFPAAGLRRGGAPSGERQGLRKNFRRLSGLARRAGLSRCRAARARVDRGQPGASGLGQRLAASGLLQGRWPQAHRHRARAADR
jgi:hypothetical protein